MNNLIDFFRTVLLLILCSCMLSLTGVSGIEVPLQGSGGGTNVGFVDMDELFAGHSGVIEAKNEYDKIKADRQKELEEMDSDVGQIRNKVKEHEKKLNEIELELRNQKARSGIVVSDILVEVDSTTVYKIHEVWESTSTLFDSTVKRVTTLNLIKDMENKVAIEHDILEEKQKELEEAVRAYGKREEEIERELAEFENRKTMKIMAECYRLIEELAREENISIVVEKNSILYGQPFIDMTERIKERLRGK